MRYVIYGAGGIGSIIGARLTMAGFEAVLIGRGEHLAALQRDGLQLKHPNPDTMERLQLACVGHPSEIEFRPDDVVLLTMKSQDTEAALDDLRYAAGDQVAVVCAQNGIENERLALRRFANVYGMFVFMPANFTQPGIVETSTWPVTGALDIGRYPEGADETAGRIADDLESAGFLSRPDPDIMRVKNTKLCENLVNAIHALFPPETDASDILARMRAEATACFDAAGLPYDERAEMMKRTKGMSVSGGGAGGGGWRGSSTWQGLVRGTGNTETDFLNGEVVLLGRLHGVPTPANAAMTVRVDRMVRDGLPPGSGDADEVRREIAERAARGV